MGGLHWLLAAALTVTLTARAEEPVRVFAAASLTTALSEVAEHWEGQGHPTPKLAFGASSTLARQIEAGAPADLFASADRAWMDYLERRARVVPGTRVDMLGNTLVMIAPKEKRFAVELRQGFDVAKAFSGKLCTGEPGIVPVGIYAKQSLEALDWWATMRSRIVGTDDVRTALTFVERGECAAGIVYATDAAISDKVEIVGRFPAATHAPIVYPFALVRGGRPEAKEFLKYLQSSPEAARVFQKHGFQVLSHSIAP